VRRVSNKALELARNGKKIGKTQEARVVLSFENDELLAKVNALSNAELTLLLMTSQATVLAKGSSDAYEPAQVIAEHADHGVHAVVLPAVGTKCQRCWNFRTNVGGNAAHADLCLQCVEVVEGEEKPA